MSKMAYGVFENQKAGGLDSHLAKRKRVWENVASPFETLRGSGSRERLLSSLQFQRLRQSEHQNLCEGHQIEPDSSNRVRLN